MAESGCLQSLRVSNLEVSQDVRIESDIEIDGNAVIDGDLTVNGTTTSLQTVNTVVKDTILELNNGATGLNANDIGILMERGTAGNNAFMGWDETADQFVIGTTLKNADDTGDLEVTEGTFRVNTLTGPTNNTLTVSAAGTGALDIDAAGAVSINSSAAAINVGDDAVEQDINIGTGAAARTITIGNDASTKVDVNALEIELDAGAKKKLSQLELLYF